MKPVEIKPGVYWVAAILNGMGWEMPVDFINLQYLPDDQELDGAREAGRKLGAAILNT